MKPPNNKGNNVPVRHLISPKKASKTGNGLCLVESLAKGVPLNLPNIISYCQGYGCSSNLMARPYC